MSNQLKGSRGELKGYTKQVGNRIHLYESNGRLLGWYDPKTNQTFNSSGQYVGGGNQLSFLFED